MATEADKLNVESIIQRLLEGVCACLPSGAGGLFLALPVAVTAGVVYL